MAHTSDAVQARYQFQRNACISVSAIKIRSVWQEDNSHDKWIGKVTWL
jgi:hypothetical protein